MDIQLDALVFGAGAAGLWLTDELRRRGRRAVLIESTALGTGQTVGSQGIIHGGLKYTLSGVLSGSATSIREMPGVWRRCLAGESEPNLSAVPLRGEYCHLWRTDSLMSIAGLVGAKAGLRVTPVAIRPNERPAVLAGCPGQVFRLDEQVIDAVRLAAVLGERNRPFVVRVERGGAGFDVAGIGQVRSVEIEGPAERMIRLHPKVVVLTAGAGNEQLRESLGLDRDAMQTRPLHMTMARGELDILNGHCVDGNRTRVTITSARHSSGDTIWQIGGQVSERGVEMAEADLIEHVRRELETVLPGFEGSRCLWASYRVNRAEGRTQSGARPEDVTMRREGHVITAWPTKLALAPLLAVRVAETIDTLCGARGSESGVRQLADDLRRLGLPQPPVARPPWESIEQWNSVH